MDPKTLFLETARSLRLTACGACSIDFSKDLSQALSKAGPVPFAPAKAEKRLSPESLLPGARSFFVILFPYKTEEREMGNIALYARSEDYHRVNHRYMDRIIEVAAKAFPQARFKALTDTSPVAGLRRRAGLLRKKPLPHPSGVRFLCHHRRHSHHPSPFPRYPPHPFLRRLPPL